MILNLFMRKKHKLDKFPQSNRNKPLYKWGGVWCEYEGGKWKPANFEMNRRVGKALVV